MIGGVSSRNRITGLATGMDVDEVVKGMMMREQAKIDKIYQDKTLLEFRQEEYRDIIKGMKEFQKYFNPTSDKYLSKSKFMTTTAKASDDKYFKVSANGSAKNGTYNVTVDKLAESAKVEGSNLANVVKVNAGEINIDGTKYSIDNDGVIKDENGKNVELSDKIKVYTRKDEAGSNEIYVENISDGEINIDGKVINNSKISENTTLESLGITTTDKDKDGNLVYKVTINGKDIDVLAETKDESGNIVKATLKDLGDAISKETNGEVKLAIDKTLNKVSLETTKTGTDAKISASGSLMDTLGLTSGEITGKDAKVTITGPDGLSTTVTSSTNSISEMGLDIKLTATGTSEVAVDKTGGIDETMKTIKSFVDDYNAIMTTINKKLSERTNFKYKPLTEEQKKDMSESEIKKWNEKVKQGILRNDPLLSALQKDLKGIFGDSIDGVNAKLGKYGEVSFGLDFSSDASNPGIIEVDEDKLKAALESKPDVISNFFTNSSSEILENNASYKNSKKYSEDGIVNRMNNIMKGYIGIPGIGDDGKNSMSGSMNIQVNKQYDYSYTGSSSRNTIPDQIYRQQLTMDKLQKKYSEKQEQLYLDFSRLETSMNKINGQMNYLMSQLG